MNPNYFYLIPITYVSQNLFFRYFLTELLLFYEYFKQCEV